MSRTINWILIVGCVISLASIGACVNVKCFYGRIEFDKTIVNFSQVCFPRRGLIITSPNETLIDSVTGNFTNGKNISDVDGFSAADATIQYFPTGLEKVFSPNLKLISLFACGLKEVHQSDLKPFPNLTHLQLLINNIEVLEEDLFAFNPELNHVDLRENDLIYIHADIFNHLNKLTYLDMTGSNNCLNITTKGNATALEIIKKKLTTKCKNRVDLVYLEIKKGLNDLEIKLNSQEDDLGKQIDEKLKMVIEKLEAEGKLRDEQQAEATSDQKAMTYMIYASVFYSSVMMVLVLAIYEYCGSFFIRRRQESTQDDENSSTSS